MPGTLTNKLLPFAEQLAALRKRTANLVPTQRWTDMQRNAHTTAFTVAGAMKADLLKDLAGAVEDSITKGLGIDYFRKQFDKIVAKHGWQYNGERNWRIRVIYQTNMATSYAAGRLSQLRSPELQKLKPFWMYRHSDSVLHPRPLHVSWDGLVLPADHPWFKTHYPPNGWGCQCRIVAVSEAEAKRRGKLFTPPDDGTAPDGTPKGIDPGWDYMPGDTESNAAHLRKVVAEKAEGLPEPLAAAMLRETPNPQFVPSTDADINAVLNRAVALVTQVHRTPNMPPIAFVREVKDLGRYNHIKRTLGIDPTSPDITPEFVALHELGHAFDYNFIGTLTASGLQWPNELLGLSSVIKASKTYRELLASSIKRRDYLLQENELWARIYSQWIAILTGDANALAGLRYHQNHADDKYRLWHWPDDEFVDIAKALERYFKRKGLR